MDKVEILGKLKALYNLISDWLYSQPRQAGSFSGTKVASFFLRYKTLQDLLRRDAASLFDDLPVQEQLGGLIPAGKADIKGLLREIKYCVDILESLTSLEIAKVTSEGVYVAGQVYDALRKIQDILSKAQQSIVIIDGYVDEKVLDMLTTKPPGVTVEILTYQVAPALSAAAVKFNQQYKNLSIRTSNAFHDRFVIIDDNDYYHFGASLKDLGKRGFMFSRIEEPTVATALKNQWIAEWSTATPVI